MIMNISLHQNIYISCENKHLSTLYPNILVLINILIYYILTEMMLLLHYIIYLYIY